MYSFAAFTIRSYSAGVVLEDGQTVKQPGFDAGRRMCRAALRAHRPLPDSRSFARVNAMSAETPLSGRTGVTTVMVSFTASNTTTMVGRTITASGIADRIRIGLRQLLHLPHHVVAEIAEDAGRHRRQRLGQFDTAFGEEGAQRLERRLVAGRETGRAYAARVAIDLGAAVDRAPDHVGIESDDRIASADRAALDRFQEEAHRPPVGDLEKADTGVSRSETSVVQTTWVSPRRVTLGERRFPAVRSAWISLCRPHRR